MIHFHPIRVSEVRRETEDTVSIAFDVPDQLRTSFAYAAGQYLTLRTYLNGEDVRRSYSLCSAPHEGQWRVAVKEVAGGAFSAWANHQLNAGDMIDVMAPQGRFVVHPDSNQSRQYVLFAAGSGITPVIAIIKEILEKEPQSQITLFYGNRSMRTVIFLEELENLKNKFIGRLSMHFIFSKELQSSPLFEGRITGERSAQMLKHFIHEKGNEQYYICGPEEMIRDIIHTLKESGVPEERIHFELFTSPVGSLGTANEVVKDVETHASERAHVKVKLDGRIFAFDLDYDGQNILDASMVTGADLPFSCKGGVCCTCRAKLVTGQVTMDANYALEPWEVSEGFILTCQSHPRSNELFVDFDQQ